MAFCSRYTAVAASAAADSGAVQYESRSPVVVRCRRRRRPQYWNHVIRPSVVLLLLAGIALV